MRWIWTKQNADGTYDEIGMNNRGLFEGSGDKARRTATEIAKNGRAVRMQGWHGHTFYRYEEPDIEYVVEPVKVIGKTPVGMVIANSIVQDPGLTKLKALDPAAPGWLFDNPAIAEALLMMDPSEFPEA